MSMEDLQAQAEAEAMRPRRTLREHCTFAACFLAPILAAVCFAALAAFCVLAQEGAIK